jgi:hypothetical protein
VIISPDSYSARVPVFERIFGHLEQHQLWGFPLLFAKDGDSNQYEKIPLVPWKPYQTRAPTRQERADFPYAHGAAIPTGPATGFLIVDADGVDAIEWVELRGIPATVIVRTKRGFHYYLRWPANLEVRNSAGSIHPGVDIRGRGGMAVAAGSRRPDGFVYEYAPGHALGELAIAAPPDWLLHWLEQENVPRSSPGALPSASSPSYSSNRTAGSFRRSAPPDFTQLAAGIPDGARDDRLFRLACWLRRRGYTPDQTRNVVLDAARRCQPPFPEPLAAAKVIGAWRYA